ncbi:MAG: Gfo/Idh/MocA family oxidoreductase [Clostridia bacterium]|nr:Gfo/Idh/MocA family oxidoreductase [Clostridia bacterium]
MLKVGLVGVGGISGGHISSWDNLENASLTSICDIRKERLERYPDKKHYLSFDEMLEAEQFDIIDICLPTYLHTEFALKCLKKGINVICEKPISLKAEDVDLIYNTAKENGAKFMVAQVLRFWPEYEFVKQVYEDKRYGKLLTGKMSRLTSYPKWSWDNWYTDESRSGLVPYDLHIHDLDFMVYLFGKPTVENSLKLKSDTNYYMRNIYNFGDFSVSAEASWYNVPYPFGAEFLFEFEDAIVSLERGSFKVYESNGKVIDFRNSSECEGEISIPKGSAYYNEIEYFANCVINNTEPDIVKPEELKTVINILNK